MRPDQIGSFLFAYLVSRPIYESGFNKYSEVVDLLKLAHAVELQDVSFGHFSSLFSLSWPEILEQFYPVAEMLVKSTNSTLSVIREEIQELNISKESPLGSIVYGGILTLESIPIYNIKRVLTNFEKWLKDESANPLPFLLPPNQLFTPINSDLLFSPFPSNGAPIPSDEELEDILAHHSHSNQQSALYLSLFHARQKKSVTATKEIANYCLRTAEIEDDQSLSRSALAFSQVLDILGMEEDSKLTLNEAIGQAKSLPDSTVLSAAVALKAKIENSNAGWRHAASMENPNVIAKIHSTLADGGSLSDILKFGQPFMAANAYATAHLEGSNQIAALLPLTESLLPIRVFDEISEGHWKEGSQLIHSLDSHSFPVRITATALACAYYDVFNNPDLETLYREELNDLLDMGTADPLIKQIADIGKNTIDEKPIYELPALLRARKMCECSRTDEEKDRALSYCQKIGYKKLANDDSIQFYETPQIEDLISYLAADE